MLGTPWDYVIGVGIVTILGFGARTFFTGLRENIVKAVVDSALKQILGGLQTGLNDVKSDVSLIKTAQQTTAATSLLYMQELHAMRQRLEDHLKTDEEFQSQDRDWRLVVSEFMDWATDFIKNHMHVGAVATEGPKAPPMVGA